ncbi:hypothetical protein [Haloarcula nitratireducens]|uniref:hypothetical protein n=1 Tax=Haloarcula nitratireducens TaxID=2487749 RepID=UPI002E2B8DA3|nr:hypothetical protein [Halomicroarcula nitratireducens]
MILTILDTLFGRDDDTGIGHDERTDRECSVCGTTFDTARTTCPACDSQIYRTRTRTPNARFNLLFVMALAGLEATYNVVTGQYPKEGPGA